MADSGVVTRLRRGLPWWVSVSLVFLASRVVSTALLVYFASIQQANAWTGPHPGYFEYAKIWDGNWYWIVAASGYPSDLPLTPDGHVAENAWAFLPAYPMLVRGLMTLTGASFEAIAVIVSVAFAWGAALLFYKLMKTALPAGSALFAVVLFCVAPLSPMLQVAYPESMFAFLLTACLYLLVKRRYVLIIPVVTVMAFTRPGALALALAMGLHVVHRLVTRDPFPVRERVAAIGSTLYTALAGFFWLLAAWAATGNLHAYTDTELAWRMPYIGYVELVPLTPWVQGANWWGATWGWPDWLGVTVLVVIVAGFAAFMFSPWVRRLGVDIRFWVASFALYILAVFFPQSSVFRILMPAFPLLGAFAVPRSPSFRIAIVLVFVALQAWWLSIGWWVNGYDWTPP